MSGDTGALVRLVEVTVRRGAKLVLDRASLDVAPGTFVTVVGPSGAGKTTVLELVLGWVEPDAGSVERAPDLRPADDGRIPWRAIAVVPQQRGLLTELSVLDNVSLPVRLGGEVDGARTADLLGSLDLTTLARRRPGEVSLGEQQRASVARALVLGSRLVLADEPTAHQDAAHADLVLDALRRAVDGGAGCLVVSHDRAVVERADHVVELTGGALRAIGANGSGATEGRP